MHAENLRNIHKIDKTELLENFIKMTQIELLEKNYSQMKGSNIWVVDVKIDNNLCTICIIIIYF